ncbi:hypothetical protein AGMMS49992_26530 [Clostridia bacterium]|nr:hypothetical protein AGMMS49992_26530 [Clostridia bacterium]
MYPYDDLLAALVVNEEGKLEKLPLNRALRDENGEIYDIVFGTFFCVGLSEVTTNPVSILLLALGLSRSGSIFFGCGLRKSPPYP